MVDIRLASDFSHSQICEAMNEAFSDYVVPMRLSESQFLEMMRQRGLDRCASRVAVVGETLAAIWLVSVRGHQGYLISSGTCPTFRSRGLARAIADDCLTALRSSGVRSFQTEVINGNEAATSLYLRLGMSVLRHLDCYEIPVKTFDPPPTVVTQTDWHRISTEASSLRDWPPSWQNSDASLTAISDRTTCLQIRDTKGLAAYAVVIPQTATLAQLAVRSDQRRTGLGSLLIGNLQQAIPNRPLRILNACADDTGYSAFLSSLGAKPTVQQSELFMAL